MRRATICDSTGAALIFDEIQCGVGRCGAFTAAESYGVVPDALTLAKGLASGLPIGAVIVGPKLAAGVKTGDLGSTFGGGPVVCAAALATLEVIDREGLIANAIAVGRSAHARRAGARHLPRQRAGACCWAFTSTGRPRRGAAGALRPSAF